MASPLSAVARRRRSDIEIVADRCCRRPHQPIKEDAMSATSTKQSSKTPQASVAARLAVHVGVYFERPEKGKYQLKKGVTTKSVSSATGSKTARKSTSKNSGSKTSKGRRAERASKTAA